MTFRVDSVRERLRKLREVLAQLEPLRDVPRAEFVRDYRHYWLAERGLQLAAEAVFDIGNHILAGRFHASAPTYEDIPRLLEEHRVIEPELRQRLRGLGGFRNLLVHDYLQLDREQLHGFLRTDLGSLSDYADAMEAFLDEDEE